MKKARRIVGIKVAVAMLFWLASGVLAREKGNTASRTDQATGSAPSSEKVSDFKVTLLGTSTPAPRPDRFGPSTLVEAGPEKMVFDCGRSCTTRCGN